MSSNRSLFEFGAHLRGVMSGGELPELTFEQLALELFRLQFTINAPYRSFCESKGASPSTVQRWAEIPAIPAVAFKELDLTSLAKNDRSAVFHSSGTTAQPPSRHYHNSESLRIYESSLLSWFQKCLDVEERISLIDLTPAGAPNSSLVHMFQTLRRAVGSEASVSVGRIDAAGAWNVEVEAASGALGRAVENDRPVLMLGTAFLFVHLIDSLRERDVSFRLPSGSRALETGGYKGRSRVLAKAELHRLIAERFGITAREIVSEYGMSELSSQAYDTVTSDRGSRGFQFPPWARARVISPENGMEVEEGQRGLLRLYDLANVYSVMAIQTEDLGIRRGRGFELLGRAVSAEARGCSLLAA